MEKGTSFSKDADKITEEETSSSGLDKDKKEKEEDIPSIPYYRLYRYATSFDFLLLTVGILAASINGAGLPVLFIFFGDITTSFTEYGKYDTCNFDYTTCKDAGLINATMTVTEFNDQIGSLQTSFRSDAIQTVLMMVYIGCATFTCSTLQVACFSLQSVRQMKEIRLEYFRSILRQDMGFHDKTPAGELNVRLSSDINKVATGTGEKISSLIQYMAMAVSGIVVGLVYTWKMGLVTLSVTPLIAISSTLFFMVSTVYTKKELSAYAKAGSIAEEAISAVRTVTALGCQGRFTDRYTVNLVDAKNTGITRGALTGLSTGALYLFMYGAYGLAFWYGTSLVLSGEIQVGDMMTAFFGIIIGAFALGTAGSYFGAISEGKAAAAKIFEVIDMVPTIDVFSTEGERPTLDGSIELKEVEFAYPTRPEAQVLKKVSLKVEQGKTVALVGHSGCGKSTIIQLIQRFYDALGGSIEIGGVDITKLNVMQLREEIGVVAQEPVLFATSIYENIRWGREGCTMEEVREAAKMANALNFIEEMPHKFDTLVGEGGGQMSGGQKQRVAIARAILRNPKILLLDEATSALDNESEAIVQSALDKASKGRTTIIVAHRLSTVRNSDVIIAFDGGRVVERGTHQELQSLGGVYSKLCKAQQFIHELDEGEVTEGEKKKEEDKKDEVFDEEVKILPNRVKSFEKKRGESRSSSRTNDYKEDKGEENVSLKRLIYLNKPEWAYMGIGTLFSAVAGSADPVSAIVFAQFLTIFTLGDPDEQTRLSILYAGAFVGIGAAAFISYTMEATLFTKAGMELTTRLRKKTFAAILRQEMSFFDNPDNNSGVLCSRLASDTTKVQGCTGGKLGLVVKNFSSLGVSLGISFAYSWKLTLLMMAFVPFLILGGLIEMKLIIGDEEAVKKEYAESSQIAVEAITNVRTIASLTREETVLRNYDAAISVPIQKKKNRSFLMGLAYGYSQCTIFFTYAAVFRLGIELVIMGDTTFDNVFKVVTAILFGALAVAQNSSFAPDFAEAQTAAHRILKLIDDVPSIDAYSEDGHKPSHCTGEIELQDTRFSYPTRQETQVLNELSAKVKQGQTLALVGQSGCGKSTTVQLIERFYDVTGGKVMIDGTDVRELNLQWLRQQIGLVSQEPVLFDLSIEDNIKYGDASREPTHDEVVKAASDANAHDFISKLPDKYSTPAGTKGGKLSGGQKQRVAIARALLRNPKILLLDEATSALDTESEKIVQSAIDAARSGRTCIVIAHRLSTVRNADVIAVVDKGRVVEIGNHEELVAMKGAYFGLVNAS